MCTFRIDCIELKIKCIIVYKYRVFQNFFEKVVIFNFYTMQLQISLKIYIFFVRYIAFLPIILHFFTTLLPYFFKNTSFIIILKKIRPLRRPAQFLCLTLYHHLSTTFTATQTTTTVSRRLRRARRSNAQQKIAVFV
jgi:hypothetical protein